MDKKNTAIIGVLLVVALMTFVFISFQKSTLNTKEISEPSATSTKTWENMPAEQPATIIPTTQKMVITAKHTYQKGEHVIAGEIPLPSPCHILDSVISASPDGMRVSVAFTSSVKTGDVCATVITPARFKLSVKAKKDAKIEASFNNQGVILNLIDLAPGENIDSFELYIKG